jgi:hypothetical protein
VLGARANRDAERTVRAAVQLLDLRIVQVIDGKIRQIEATVHSVPYRMHPGWPAE